MSEFKHLIEKAKIVISRLEKNYDSFQVLPSARELHDELEKLFGDNEVVATPEPAVATPEVVAEEPVVEAPVKTKRAAAAKSE